MGSGTNRSSNLGIGVYDKLIITLILMMITRDQGNIELLIKFYKNWNQFYIMQVYSPKLIGRANININMHNT